MGNRAQLLNYRLSFYLLEKMTTPGLHHVGIYATAVKLAEALWIISRGISMVQYAQIANLNDRKAAQNLTVKLLKVSVLSTVVLVIPLVLLPVEFYSWLFRNTDFAEVKPALLLLAPGILVFAASGIFSHYFSGVGRYEINPRSSLIGLVFTVILGLLLVPRWDITGAAATASVSYFASTVYQWMVFRKETGLSLKALIPMKADFQAVKELLSAQISSTHRNN